MMRNMCRRGAISLVCLSSASPSSLVRSHPSLCQQASGSFLMVARRYVRDQRGRGPGHLGGYPPPPTYYDDEAGMRNQGPYPPMDGQGGQYPSQPSYYNNSQPSYYNQDQSYPYAQQPQPQPPQPYLGYYQQEMPQPQSGGPSHPDQNRNNSSSSSSSSDNPEKYWGKIKRYWLLFGAFAVLYYFVMKYVEYLFLWNSDALRAKLKQGHMCLLISSPAMPDFFHSTVVLLTLMDPRGGTSGLILNKPLIDQKTGEVTKCREALKKIDTHIIFQRELGDNPVFVGGPVRSGVVPHVHRPVKGDNPAQQRENEGYVSFITRTFSDFFLKSDREEGKAAGAGKSGSKKATKPSKKEGTVEGEGTAGLSQEAKEFWEERHQKKKGEKKPKSLLESDESAGENEKTQQKKEEEPVNIFLLHSVKSVKNASEISPGIYFGGDLGSLRRKIRNGEASPKDVMVIVGYSGWGAKQMEYEISNEAWKAVCSTNGVASADSSSLLGKTPEGIEREEERKACQDFVLYCNRAFSSSDDADDEANGTKKTGSEIKKVAKKENLDQSSLKGPSNGEEPASDAYEEDDDVTPWHPCDDETTTHPTPSIEQFSSLAQSKEEKTSPTDQQSASTGPQSIPVHIGGQPLPVVQQSLATPPLVLMSSYWQQLVGALREKETGNGDSGSTQQGLQQAIVVKKGGNEDVREKEASVASDFASGGPQSLAEAIIAAAARAAFGESASISFYARRGDFDGILKAIRFEDLTTGVRFWDKKEASSSSSGSSGGRKE